MAGSAAAASSFGPVASVVRVKTVEDAIRVGNDTEYGLFVGGFRPRRQSRIAGCRHPAWLT
jgi:acyl-CoA reductase-like NAD-dependent aldehyde dehydrogenase